MLLDIANYVNSLFKDVEGETLALAHENQISQRGPNIDKFMNPTAAM